MAGRDLDDGAASPLLPMHNDAIPGIQTSAHSTSFANAGIRRNGRGVGRRRYDRLVDRKAVYSQSNGTIAIVRSRPAETRWLQMADWFHELLNQSTVKLIIVIVILYLVIIMVWAGFYLLVSPQCELGLNGSFTRAMMLSTETITTIGFGVPETYFDACPEGPALVFLQSMFGVILDAFCIGLIFSRVSRGQRRATTIIFSDKAVLRQIDGAWYFMWQVCELRRHQLVEGHVRCYAIRHHKLSATQTVYFQSHAMRLVHPDDELGGMLLLAFPSVVVHRIDAWSPLAPPAALARHRQRLGSECNPSVAYSYPEILQRSADALAGNREILGNVRETRGDCQLEIGEDELVQHLQDTRLEVLCLVEGIEAATSFTVQARHSYTLADMAVNKTFAQCVTEAYDGSCVVDFHVFHDLVDVQEEAHQNSPRSTSSSKPSTSDDDDSDNARLWQERVQLLSVPLHERFTQSA